MKLAVAVAGFILASALSGCATAPVAVSCPVGLKQTQTAELYFGRNIPDGGQVSESDWSDFVAKDITPLFPAGFTVLDAAGQWRGDKGETVQEPSKIVVLVLSDAAKDASLVTAIRDSYVKRFRQEAVLVVERPACADF